MRNISKYILRTALIAAIFVMGEGVMWGGNNYYAAKMTVSATGNGTVYIGTKGVTSLEKPEEKSEDKEQDVTFDLHAEPDSEYHFVSWTFGKGQGTIKNETGLNIKAKDLSVTVKTASGTNDTQRDGYYKDDNDNTISYYNYTATATFERDTYIVHFDKNGKNGEREVAGDQMPDQTFQRNVEQAISTNQYVLNYTVTYDANGGKVNSQDTWSETKTRFTRWKAYYEGDYNTEIHTDIEFTDGKAISLDEEHGAKLVFQATWADKLYFLFPDAKLGDRSMDGWFYSKTPGQGDTPKGKPGEEVSMTTATLYAKWGDPFYASMSLEKTEGASADPSADYGILSSDNKNSNLTFNLTAAAPAEGYHFTGWTDASEGVKMASLTPSGTDPLKATAIVKSSQTAGESNANQYKARANYEINTYYAKLVAEDCEHGSVTVVKESTKSSTESGGYVEFELDITPDKYYHLEGLTFSPSTGKKVTKDGKTYARVQLPEGDDYGEDKAKNYSIKATFAEDKYNAKLTTKVSSISDGSSSIAQVSVDRKTWSDEQVADSDNPLGDVTFYVKAEPTDGFKFIGWSADDGSETIIPELGREGEYIVKASETEGDINAETIYAIFKRQYDIVINSSLMYYGANNDRIIFDVTGPETYRVSVPIKGSVKITDVAKGTYTVTPVSAWCWKYNFDSASREITCDAESVNAVTFNATKKITSKKSAENHNTISY